MWTKGYTTSSTDSPTRLACSMHESVSASYSYTAQLRSCFGCTLFDRLLLVQSMCTTRQQAPPASACSHVGQRCRISSRWSIERGRRRSCRGGILLSCPVRAGFQLSTSTYHAWEARRVADNYYNYYGPFLSFLLLCFFFPILHCRLSFKLARLCNLPKGDGIKLVIPDSCRSGHVLFRYYEPRRGRLARKDAFASIRTASNKKKWRLMFQPFT